MLLKTKLVRGNLYINSLCIHFIFAPSKVLYPFGRVPGALASSSLLPRPFFACPLLGVTESGAAEH